MHLKTIPGLTLTGEELSKKYTFQFHLFDAAVTLLSMLKAHYHHAKPTIITVIVSKETTVQC